MSVLVIGNLGGLLSDATHLLLERGHKISQAETASNALSTMRKGFSPLIILMDVGQDIPSFIDQLKRERFAVPVVACCVGKIDKSKAYAAIEAGAKEFIPFPPDPEVIADIFDALQANSSPLLFQDEVMKKTMALASKIAKSEATVLITGESGTGKEVMARYIHEHSKRAKKTFVSVNCAAIPENLLESELFGHEKGAFTGAIARRIGKFEEASNGTLLLDEISEMHPRLQAKLLRAIQEREIDRVGGTKPVSVNFRLIATSNRDMHKAIQEGSFREDLYFRLSVIHLALPPLRDRPGDISLLANHFLNKYIKLNDIKTTVQLSQRAEQALTKHSWPGNVRELENVMHRAVLIAENSTILPEHLGIHKKEAQASEDALAPLVGQSLALVEHKLIMSTLSRCNQDNTRAAQLLGLSLKALKNKIQHYEETLSDTSEAMA